MEKKNLIVNILLFIFLTSLEMGIFIEVWRQSWGPGGFNNGLSMEYTKEGSIGSAFLLYFIPVSVIVISFIRIITLYKKRIHNMKGLIFFDCIGAVCGIIIGIVLTYAAPRNPIIILGRLIAALPFHYFDWLRYPAP